MLYVLIHSTLLKFHMNGQRMLLNSSWVMYYLFFIFVCTNINKIESRGEECK